jgi:2-(1,2-epoxy-1,2-dihydrophenyl)acetyl-CoA isomerase
MTALETGSEQLLAEVDDGVAVVTMNRPERRNALTVEMLDALGRVLAGLERDEAVGAVVITGAGGAFCAGGDVKTFAAEAAQPPAADRAQRQLASQLATSGRLWAMAKPTLAVLPGPAAGAGLSLALACDLRWAADTAVLTTAFANVALSGDYGSAWFLAHLVGPARAQELLYLPERLTAQRALELGLVNAVLPAAELTAGARDIAVRLAHGPRGALRSMKENVRLAMSASLEEYMAAEVARHVAGYATADHAEAARAFVEKRKPDFGR